jgi:hypothetical protein
LAGNNDANSQRPDVDHTEFFLERFLFFSTWIDDMEKSLTKNTSRSNGVYVPYFDGAVVAGGGKA